MSPTTTPERVRELLSDRKQTAADLDRIGDAGLTAQVCGKTPRAVYYAIRDLGPRGILVKPGGRYSVNPRLAPLKALLAELAKVDSHKRLRDADPKARLLWSLGPEVLFKSDEELDQPGVHVAALSAFAAYDVPLIMRGTYYYLAQRSLDVADAILQGFLVEPDCRANRSYCALVYEKHRPKNLVAKARGKLNLLDHNVHRYYFFSGDVPAPLGKTWSSRWIPARRRTVPERGS
jgi:hypothetical protein